MKYLLDTHVWLWMDEVPDRLGGQCRSELERPDVDLAVATISTLEIAQLLSVGRLALRGTLDSWVRRSLEELTLTSLEMTHSIAALAYALPAPFHKDPADRVLVATASHHGLTLITADERILAYPHVMSYDARQ